MDQKEQRERESGRTISLVTFTSAWHVIQNWEYVVLEKLAYWVLNHFLIILSNIYLFNQDVLYLSWLQFGYTLAQWAGANQVVYICLNITWKKGNPTAVWNKQKTKQRIRIFNSTPWYQKHAVYSTKWTVTFIYPFNSKIWSYIRADLTKAHAYLDN
jgi:hypothetical protein